MATERARMTTMRKVFLWDRVWMVIAIVFMAAVLLFFGWWWSDARHHDVVAAQACKPLYAAAANAAESLTVDGLNPPEAPRSSTRTCGELRREGRLR